ncbi:MAG: M23 family metallopeptidase, partial [Chloroflexota bacterium]
QPNDSALLPIDAEVQVAGGTYGREIINLLEGRDDLLNENVEAAELELLQNAVSAFTPERYFDDTMGLPAAAAVTSGFGTLRSYDAGAEFNRFHSGTDFAGAPGSPILAPADGRIVLADTLNVRGNATMIDHGWGIVTGYWHQTEIYVTPGEFVETGQVIGTIGSTGRVTGAHLHWELWVNGVPVDPMQWVQQPFLTFSGQLDL